MCSAGVPPGGITALVPVNLHGPVVVPGPARQPHGPPGNEIQGIPDNCTASSRRRVALETASLVTRSHVLSAGQSSSCPNANSGGFRGHGTSSSRAGAGHDSPAPPVHAGRERARLRFGRPCRGVGNGRDGWHGDGRGDRSGGSIAERGRRSRCDIRAALRGAGVRPELRGSGRGPGVQRHAHLHAACTRRRPVGASALLVIRGTLARAAHHRAPGTPHSSGSPAPASLVSLTAGQ